MSAWLSLRDHRRDQLPVQPVTTLYIRDNDNLTALLREIAWVSDLSNLTEPYKFLRNGSLAALPDSLGDLSNLTKLNIYYNVSFGGSA